MSLQAIQELYEPDSTSYDSNQLVEKISYAMSGFVLYQYILY